MRRGGGKPVWSQKSAVQSPHHSSLMNYLVDLSPELGPGPCAKPKAATRMARPKAIYLGQYNHYFTGPSLSLVRFFPKNRAAVRPACCLWASGRWVRPCRSRLNQGNPPHAGGYGRRQFLLLSTDITDRAAREGLGADGSIPSGCQVKRRQRLPPWDSATGSAQLANSGRLTSQLNPQCGYQPRPLA